MLHTHSIKRSDRLHRLHQRILLLRRVAEFLQRFFMRYLLRDCFETRSLSWFWRFSWKSVKKNTYLIFILWISLLNLSIYLLFWKRVDWRFWCWFWCRKLVVDFERSPRHSLQIIFWRESFSSWRAGAFRSRHYCRRESPRLVKLLVCILTNEFWIIFKLMTYHLRPPSIHKDKLKRTNTRQLQELTREPASGTMYSLSNSLHR